MIDVRSAMSPDGEPSVIVGMRTDEYDDGDSMTIALIDGRTIAEEHLTPDAARRLGRQLFRAAGDDPANALRVVIADLDKKIDAMEPGSTDYIRAMGARSLMELTLRETIADWESDSGE